MIYPTNHIKCMCSRQEAWRWIRCPKVRLHGENVDLVVRRIRLEVNTTIVNRQKLPKRSPPCDNWQAIALSELVDGQRYTWRSLPVDLDKSRDSGSWWESNNWVYQELSDIDPNVVLQQVYSPLKSWKTPEFQKQFGCFLQWEQHCRGYGLHRDRASWRDWSSEHERLHYSQIGMLKFTQPALHVPMLSGLSCLGVVVGRTTKQFDSFGPVSNFVEFRTCWNTKSAFNKNIPAYS